MTTTFLAAILPQTVGYTATTYWVIAADLIFAAIFLRLLQKGKASPTTISLFGLGSLLWIGFLYRTFEGGHIFPPNISGAAFYAVILAAVAVVFALFAATLRKVFANLSQEQIQIAHGFRVFIGAGFLMEGVLAVIPGWFGIMDGYLHIASGFLALSAAIALLRNSPSKKLMLWLANLVGISDVLIIATSICFAVWNDLGPFHNMMYIVFYVAPMLLWLHTVSIVKLLQKTPPEN